MLRKWSFYSILLILVLCVLSACDKKDAETSVAKKAEPISIGIISIIEHPALNAVRDGFKDSLSENGYKEGENISYSYKNAKGSTANAHQIVAGFIGDKANLIMAIGTPVAQVAAGKTKEIPILIAAITDPVGAGLVQSIEKPGGNITGTSDMNPIRSLLELIKDVLPSAKKVGILYNNGEANSVVLVERARNDAKALSLELVEATALNTSGVQAAVASLVGKVDAVYMPTDNTMAAAIDVIIDVCSQNNIPFFSSEDKSVKEGGALASIAVDYYKLGKQTGSMALEVIKGASPATIPVEFQKDFNLFVNKAVAQKLGVTVPQSVLSRATEVIE